MAREILLNQTKVAIVDDEDYEWLMQWKWGYCAGYAARIDYSRGRNNRIRVRMHRLIVGAPANKVVDHINHNTLDNRRSNLRCATAAENSRNQQAHKSEASTSQYKGVYWREDMQKWHARIMVNYRHVHLGYFVNEYAAALAYDAAAVTFHGEFALLNLPQEIGSF